MKAQGGPGGTGQAAVHFQTAGVGRETGPSSGAQIIAAEVRRVIGDLKMLRQQVDDLPTQIHESFRAETAINATIEEIEKVRKQVSKVSQTVAHLEDRIGIASKGTVSEDGEETEPGTGLAGGLEQVQRKLSQIDAAVQAIPKISGNRFLVWLLNPATAFALNLALLAGLGFVLLSIYVGSRKLGAALEGTEQQLKVVADEEHGLAPKMAKLDELVGKTNSVSNAVTGLEKSTKSLNGVVDQLKPAELGKDISRTIDTQVKAFLAGVEENRNALATLDKQKADHKTNVDNLAKDRTVLAEERKTLARKFALPNRSVRIIFGQTNERDTSFFLEEVEPLRRFASEVPEESAFDVDLYHLTGRKLTRAEENRWSHPSPEDAASWHLVDPASAFPENDSRRKRTCLLVACWTEDPPEGEQRIPWGGIAQANVLLLPPMTAKLGARLDSQMKKWQSFAESKQGACVLAQLPDSGNKEADRTQSRKVVAEVLRGWLAGPLAP